MASEISESLKKQVKQSAIFEKRYKIVTFVAIGQKDWGQVQLVSRCVWNDHFDTVAEGKYMNESIYAVALVYGIYLE